MNLYVYGYICIMWMCLNVFECYLICFQPYTSLQGLGYWNVRLRTWTGCCTKTRRWKGALWPSSMVGSVSNGVKRFHRIPHINSYQYYQYLRRNITCLHSR